MSGSRPGSNTSHLAKGGGLPGEGGALTCGTKVILQGGKGDMVSIIESLLVVGSALNSIYCWQRRRYVIRNQSCWWCSHSVVSQEEVILGSNKKVKEGHS